MEESFGEVFKAGLVSVIDDKYEFIHEPIHDKCVGCERTIEINNITYCKAYYCPGVKWKHDIWICPLATHVKVEDKTSKEKQRIGQQKQKKKK